LGEAQPPGGRALRVIVVVKQFKNRVTGEREKCVAVEDAGLGLEERVGAEAVLVDFEHKFAVAAIGPERAGRQARVHDRIEVAKTEMASVRLNTMDNLPASSPPTALSRRQQNRPIDEADFEQIRMFANCGLHWAGIQTWFERPLKEVKRYVFDAWPDLFRRIEVNDGREAKKKEYRRR
jgi:hypothetical protein